jgi:hypothetical protein
MPLVLQVDRLELPMGQYRLRNNKDDYKLKKNIYISIGDDFMDVTLP